MKIENGGRNKSESQRKSTDRQYKRSDSSQRLTLDHDSLPSKPAHAQATLSSPFEQMLYKQLVDMMTIVLIFSATKQDPSQDIELLKHRISGFRAEQAVKEELELIEAKLNLSGVIGNVNNRIHACSHLFSVLLKDLQDAVLGGERVMMLKSLTEERDSARCELSSMRDKLSERVGSLETLCTSLQEENSRLLSKSEALREQLRSLRGDLDRTQESLQLAHRRNTELRLQGLHWQKQADFAAKNLLRCAKQKVGFLPADICEALKQFGKLKPPGDEDYAFDKDGSIPTSFISIESLCCNCKCTCGRRNSAGSSVSSLRRQAPSSPLPVPVLLPRSFDRERRQLQRSKEERASTAAFEGKENQSQLSNTTLNKEKKNYSVIS